MTGDGIDRMKIRWSGGPARESVRRDIDIWLARTFPTQSVRAVAPPTGACRNLEERGLPAH
jgi:hypothetical protein